MIAPDTSVLVAVLAPWHEGHGAARAALVGQDVALIGHVAVETTSALSRMPEGHRVAPSAVIDALTRGFPHSWLTLDGDGLRRALLSITAAGIRGGAINDGLIALTSAASGARLVSADRRALPTYETLGVDFTVIP